MTLFSSFRSACGFSPMEFLWEHRLHAVRCLLLNPLTRSSVPTVDLVVHLGRFSSSCPKCFGEAPSATLK
ncbi:hypothetical protein [Haloferula sp.]|uniref:hypothetical protein n=1 Tax=Haloferula sp. TaxID=2497595 RepID=UPI003AF7986B